MGLTLSKIGQLAQIQYGVVLLLTKKKNCRFFCSCGGDGEEVGEQSEAMNGEEEARTGDGSEENVKFVYRISTSKEWKELQNNGSSNGGPLDKTTGCIHLSKLNQVKSTLHNFFLDCKEDLYLLQIDAKKLGDGLVYEAVDATNSFPHFYGPSRSFSPLPLDVVTKAEKLSLTNGQFTCSLLD